MYETRYWVTARPIKITKIIATKRYDIIRKCGKKNCVFKKKTKYKTFTCYETVRKFFNDLSTGVNVRFDANLHRDVSLTIYPRSQFKY